MRCEINNMLFDDDNEDCFVVIVGTQGHSFAFVQALDLGMKHSRLKKPHKARYWGVWDSNEPQLSLTEILKNGGYWPTLPK